MLVCPFTFCSRRARRRDTLCSRSRSSRSCWASACILILLWYAFSSSNSCCSCIFKTWHSASCASSKRSWERQTIETFHYGVTTHDTQGEDCEEGERMGWDFVFLAIQLVSIVLRFTEQRTYSDKERWQWAHSADASDADEQWRLRNHDPSCRDQTAGGANIHSSPFARGKEKISCSVQMD